MHANQLVVSRFVLYRYPRDLDKEMLAKQTGLSKSQVSFSLLHICTSNTIENISEIRKLIL